jgi:polyhydroxyalkanoate synthase
VVHQEQQWSLLRYRARPQGLAFKTPILLVPSLINRHYVLDLMPGKSFVEFLRDRGHDVFILDWGRPRPQDKHQTFDQLCGSALGRAIRRSASCAGSRKVHLLGYCLGATFTTIHACVYPEHIASMVALAPPISFSDDGLLATWMRLDSLKVDKVLSAFGNMPWPLMQLAFHSLRPTLNLTKLVGVLDMAGDDAFLDGFLAIETWGNDNVSFPGACFARYIRDLYQNNALVEGRFMLDGRAALLSNIRCPLLSVTFKHDTIVPYESSAPLVEMASSEDKTQWDLDGGHVGAVVSRKASTKLWPALAEWWEARDSVS